NLSELDVWAQINTLREKGYIRRLGGVFEAKKLGYRSALCGAKVPLAKLNEIIALINSSPRVTHNYLRTGDLNLWFTFTSNHIDELPEFIDYLKKKTGIDEIYLLEAEKLFKLKVDFKL
ncbi:MAG: Lrp/AsnC family transcriptional regulator, partial [Candidatus Adiutrix sp.]